MSEKLMMALAILLGVVLFCAGIAWNVATYRSCRRDGLSARTCSAMVIR